MGATQFKCQPPKINQFQLLNYGYCTVWKRKSDQLQLMEQYDIEIDTEDKLNLYKSLWTIRTKNPFLVNVCYFTHQNSKNFCGSLECGSIFTQRIYYRLSQFSNINYQEGMSILQTCFNGYKILYQTAGLFLIRSTMIGFNQQMKVKVWHHTDYSQAEPQNPNCNSLIQMIKSIIECVQRNLSIPYDYPKFSQFLSDKSFYLTNFNQIQIGLDQYSRINGLLLKSSNSSIKSFLRKAQGWQLFAIKSQYQKYQHPSQGQGLRQGQGHLHPHSHSHFQQIKQSQFSKTINPYQKPTTNFRQSNQNYHKNISINKNINKNESSFEDPLSLSKTIKKQYYSNNSNPYFDTINRSDSNSKSNNSSIYMNLNSFQFAKQQKTPKPKTRINKPQVYMNLRMNKQRQEIQPIESLKGNNKNNNYNNNYNYNERSTKSQEHFQKGFKSKQNQQIKQISYLRPKLIRQPQKINNNLAQQNQNRKSSEMLVQNQYYNTYSFENPNQNSLKKNNLNSYYINTNKSDNFYSPYHRNINKIQETEDKSKSKSLLSSSISLIEDLQAKHRVQKILNKGHILHRY